MVGEPKLGVCTMGLPMNKPSDADRLRKNWPRVPSAGYRALQHVVPLFQRVYDLVQKH